MQDLMMITFLMLTCGCGVLLGLLHDPRESLKYLCHFYGLDCWIGMAGNQVLEWADLDTEIKTAGVKSVSKILVANSY